MKTTLEILKEARALIEDPARWTRKIYARDEQGFGVSETDPEAVCFCSLGAIAKVSGVPTYQLSNVPTYQLSTPFHFLGYDPVVLINDTRGHAAVLRLFDLAIAAEEATVVR